MKTRHARQIRQGILLARFTWKVEHRLARRYAAADAAEYATAHPAGLIGHTERAYWRTRDALDAPRPASLPADHFGRHG